MLAAGVHASPAHLAVSRGDRRFTPRLQTLTNTVTGRAGASAASELDSAPVSGYKQIR